MEKITIIKNRLNNLLKDDEEIRFNVVLFINNLEYIINIVENIKTVLFDPIISKDENLFCLIEKFKKVEEYGLLVLSELERYTGKYSKYIHVYHYLSNYYKGNNS